MKFIYLKIAVIFLMSGNLYGFSTTNIQYLYGSFDGNTGIDTQNGGKSTVTLEHYSTNPIGDLYGFADYSVADDRYKGSDKKSDLYFEISPRVSLNKVSGKNLSFGIFKDWYLSAQYNRKVHKFDDYIAYLYGAGTNLDLPGFNVFGVNFYKKDKNGSLNDTYQLTLNYKSIDMFGTKFMFNGFADFTEDDTMIQNQLSYRLPHIDSLGDSKVYLGTEWIYYTLKHTSKVSNTLQVMLKVVW